MIRSWVRIPVVPIFFSKSVIETANDVSQPASEYAGFMQSIVVQRNWH
ncbi:hypothetical protein BU14_0051s0031 [Porphyra umbilicalis]|uniref:Uncharacterized protein n=1 Tax=Porphyra umbilicalis TaxID=2786 RepID=A0A1X6PI20_PORUM|nr:hypothetical protein BU14_0051s0031 [Porphyra umbilicalis]|eukprot:OSX80511.1 hypothetical protein BU14_0051s0031 [Porphyra umbilicalis]